MKKCILCLLLVTAIAAAIYLHVKSETIDNNILLFVFAENVADARLEWAVVGTPPPPPYVYKVYRSIDPAILGSKIATVNGSASGGIYVDTGVLLDDTLYYYQILRVND